MVDLHGHSVKNNAFMYGCDAHCFDNGSNHPSRTKPKAFESRMLPALLGNNCKSFSFQDCRFHVRRRKESSGRVVAWRQFTNMSYTLEASFGGADEEHFPAASHFGVNHYMQMGRDLCATLDEYFCSDVNDCSEMRQNLLKQVEDTVLADANGDSDGDDNVQEKGLQLSSDDDSDDDTVETIVLPKKVLLSLRMQVFNVLMLSISHSVR